jgi:hypothetical protein
LGYNTLDAQQRFTVELSPTTEHQINRYYDSSQHVHYDGTDDRYHIGMRNESIHVQRITWRSYFNFNLNAIPLYAKIYNASLIITINSNDIDSEYVSVRAHPYVGSTFEDSTEWKRIGYFTEYTRLKYELANNTLFSSQQLLDSVIAANNVSPYDRFQVGVMCANELRFNSVARVQVKLRIEYSYGVRIIVRNSFPNGMLYRDQDNDPIQSPYTYYATHGEQHLFSGFDQDANGVAYEFRNKWAYNGDTINVQEIHITADSNITSSLYKALYDTGFHITVKNSFGGGNVKVDERRYNNIGVNGVSVILSKNITHNLLALNQDFVDPTNNVHYFRIYQYWKKDEDPNFYYSNPETIIVSGEATYTANFKKQFNVTIQTAQYLETGSGGKYFVNGTDRGSTWVEQVIQDESRVIQAVPPDGWYFIQWNDGNTNNPRTITPTDHDTLYAVYKKHLASTTSAATASNAQHKMVRLEDGRLLTVYESGDLIFSSISEDEGETWNPEFMFDDERGDMDGAKFRSPSICMVDNIAYLTFEVYDENDENYQNKHWILVYKFNGENWRYFSTVDEFEGYDESFQAAPVIAGGKWRHNNSIVLWVWKHPEGLKISGCSLEGNTTSFLNPELIPTTTSHSTSPSLAVESYGRYTSEKTYFHIVWDEEENINYIVGNYTFDNGSFAFSETENVTQGYREIYQSSNPTIQIYPEKIDGNVSQVLLAKK